MQKQNFLCDDEDTDSEVHGVVSEEPRTPKAEKRLFGALVGALARRNRPGRPWQVIKGKPDADVVLLRLTAHQRRAMRALRPLRLLNSAFQESRSILQLEDDWDDNGSPAINEETWLRATQFVLRTGRFAWERLGVEVPPPRILPGSDGSIDIEWFDAARELLINIPADASAPASFYGDNRGALKIKGTFAPASINLGIVEWLTNNQ